MRLAQNPSFAFLADLHPGVVEERRPPYVVFDGALREGDRVPQREIAATFGVSSIPTLLVFKNGSVESFDLIGPNDPDEVYALVRARTKVIDRHGMPSVGTKKKDICPSMLCSLSTHRKLISLF